MIKYRKGSLVLALFSAVTGMTLAIAMKDNMTEYTESSLRNIDDLKNSISANQAEIDDTDKIIAQKKAELELLTQDGNREPTEVKDELEAEIEDVKLAAGLTELTGPGVEITVADNADRQVVGKSINDDIIHDADLQIILNDLRVSGAEAISINGNRVVALSEVKCGGPVVTVNGRATTNPFVISAIGDPAALSAAVSGPETYAYLLKNTYKLNIEVSEQENLIIPAYEWKPDGFKYLEIEED